MDPFTIIGSVAGVISVVVAIWYGQKQLEQGEKPKPNDQISQNSNQRLSMENSNPSPPPLPDDPRKLNPQPILPFVEPPGTYVERPPIEEQCYDAISDPNTALIHITAPEKMGKTELIARILHHANKKGYRTASLSLQLAKQEFVKGLDSFLRWFCLCVERELGLQNELEQLWDINLGKYSCLRYFKQQILAKLDTPLVLALDEADQIFHYPDLAVEFFSLLRTFHEEGRKGDKTWQKLRLVLAYATEDYPDFPEINQSPFNVGLPIKLPDFTEGQVQDLSHKYNKKYTNQAENFPIEPLMKKIGGHPFLLSEAFYYLTKHFISIEELLQKAATDKGIYSGHLQHLFASLQEYPDLVEAMEKVLATDESVQLQYEQAVKLESLGLIRREGNKVRIRYNLYREYFSQRLGVSQ